MELALDDVRLCTRCGLPLDACRKTCHIPPSLGMWLREYLADHGSYADTLGKSCVTSTGDLPGECV
jgi:hypothetical protein